MLLQFSATASKRVENMPPPFLWLILLFALLVSPLCVQSLQSTFKEENGVKSAVFLSPLFVLGPGSVKNKVYFDVDFPRGHIAVKDFNAEVVDEMGNPVPLHETYLHHWGVMRYYGLKGTHVVPKDNNGRELHLSQMIVVKNSGICLNTLGQYFGLGSETRRTTTYVPDPYGIEVGNPEEIPDGYEERWLLNVHAIDTRGVEDRVGCTECRCDLYNITIDEYGRPLPPGYGGGMYCCYDKTQCRVKKGIVSSIKRSLYLRYTVKWVDWEDSIVPVKIYILDVTDNGERVNPTGSGPRVRCKVEYNVEACNTGGALGSGCIDNKKARMVMPNGGHVVYAVAHQHSGGRGSALYGEDGRVICSSIPVYGQGNEPGNEADYVVGMSTCYPQPGSVKIDDGEALVLESNYSSIQKHTGVMGLFYLLVAEQPPKPATSLQISSHGKLKMFNYTWAVVFIMVVAVAIVAVVVYLRRTENGSGYQPL